jgi:5-methyltetrahydropteroyltriglutamate--homocysteine methyltransferase
MISESKLLSERYDKMRNSIIAYPRIGEDRELKFWTEDYFDGNLSKETLESSARELREKQWRQLAASGIDFIPSNDFSFYDGMLDMAVLLNAIPEAYQSLGLDELDTSFAMARGYQGAQGDVKALPMKKWFNTNYHYIVPLLEDNTELKLNSDGNHGDGSLDRLISFFQALYTS